MTKELKALHGLNEVQINLDCDRVLMFHSWHPVILDLHWTKTICIRLKKDKEGHRHVFKKMEKSSLVENREPPLDRKYTILKQWSRCSMCCGVMEIIAMNRWDKTLPLSHEITSVTERMYFQWTNTYHCFYGKWRKSMKLSYHYTRSNYIRKSGKWLTQLTWSK